MCASQRRELETVLTSLVETTPDHIKEMPCSHPQPLCNILSHWLREQKSKVHKAFSCGP